jgi:hypothetical protein
MPFYLRRVRGGPIRPRQKHGFYHLQVGAREGRARLTKLEIRQQHCFIRPGAVAYSR